MKNILRTLFVSIIVSMPSAFFAQAKEDPIPKTGFIALIAAHVVLGIIGIAALYAMTMALLRKIPSTTILRLSSVTALVSFVASWITGGIYYVLYYGGAVKPAILSGSNPFAHSFFMETKEHLFLFLPFFSLVLVAVSFFAGDLISKDTRVRYALCGISGLGVLIGIFSTLSGVIISGSV